MSRPEFPNCVMTPEVINRIRQDQERYDQDPESYEAFEREQQEQYELESQRVRESYETEEQEIQYKNPLNDNDLPF